MQLPAMTVSVQSSPPRRMMNRDTRLVALALFLWGLGEGLFLHIQPLHIEHLGAGPVQLGGALSLAAIARAVVFLPAGLLADRLPRKPLILGAWIIGPAGAILMGLARSWRGLAPGLMLYGLSAYCIPVINAYLAHTVDSESVARTFATVYAVHTVGGVISPALGGWLATAVSFRTVYFTSAALFGLSALAAIQLGSQPIPARRPGSGYRLPAAGRQFFTFVAVVLLTFSAMYLSFPLAPNFLVEARGLDLTRVGVLGSLQALGMSAFGLLLGRLGRGGRAWGLAAGQVVVWVSALLLLVSGAFPVVGIAFVLRGAYQGCRSLAQARSSRLGREGERGLLLGTTETVIAAAQIIAPYAAGWLYAGSPASPLHATLALVPLAMLLTLFVMPRS
jgi:YNFM family putative membrane transporter